MHSQMHSQLCTGHIMTRQVACMLAAVSLSASLAQCVSVYLQFLIRSVYQFAPASALL